MVFPAGGQRTLAETAAFIFSLSFDPASVNSFLKIENIFTNNNWSGKITNQTADVIYDKNPTIFSMLSIFQIVIVALLHILVAFVLLQ